VAATFRTRRSHCLLGRPLRGVLGHSSDSAVGFTATDAPPVPLLSGQTAAPRPFLKFRLPFRLSLFLKPPKVMNLNCVREHPVTEIALLCAFC
jgi:hypothetical protein